MPRFTMMLLLLLAACDSDVSQPPSSVAIYSVERECSPRSSSVIYDLGVEPLWWSVDIGYPIGGDTVWSPMSAAPETGTVIYQDGTALHFPCGYLWSDGLQLAGGEKTESATRFRIAYGVIE